MVCLISVETSPTQGIADAMHALRGCLPVTSDVIFVMRFLTNQKIDSVHEEVLVSYLKLFGAAVSGSLLFCC